MNGLALKIDTAEQWNHVARSRQTELSSNDDKTDFGNIIRISHWLIQLRKRVNSR